MYYFKSADGARIALLETRFSGMTILKGPSSGPFTLETSPNPPHFLGRPNVSDQVEALEAEGLLLISEGDQALPLEQEVALRKASKHALKVVTDTVVFEALEPDALEREATELIAEKAIEIGKKLREYVPELEVEFAEHSNDAQFFSANDDWEMRFGSAAIEEGIGQVFNLYDNSFYSSASGNTRQGLFARLLFIYLARAFPQLPLKSSDCIFDGDRGLSLEGLKDERYSMFSWYDMVPSVIDKLLDTEDFCSWKDRLLNPTKVAPNLACLTL